MVLWAVNVHQKVDRQHVQNHLAVFLYLKYDPELYLVKELVIQIDDVGEVVGVVDHNQAEVAEVVGHTNLDYRYLDWRENE